MSSIRRSSLISITLGLPTVIGGYLSFASLKEAAGQRLEVASQDALCRSRLASIRCLQYPFVTGRVERVHRCPKNSTHCHRRIRRIINPEATPAWTHG